MPEQITDYHKLMKKLYKDIKKCNPEVQENVKLLMYTWKQLQVTTILVCSKLDELCYCPETASINPSREKTCKIKQDGCYCCIVNNFADETDKELIGYAKKKNPDF